MSAKRVNETLPEWRQIAEALPTMVFATRPDGYAIFFNQHWYDFTGLSPERSLGRGWRRSIQVDDAETLVGKWEACLRDGTPFEHEFRLRKRDGSYEWFLGRANPVVGESGTIVRWFGTCTGIEAQKRNEEAYAELYRRERRIADTLQRALLPPVLPKLPGLWLDAVYQPDTDEANVGGDWYDAFELYDQRIAFSMGDVAGHGLEAAILMGRVREALRAAAIEGNDPARVLALANASIELLEQPAMVTALFGILDRLTMRLTFACAGHPPPVLARADGRVERLLAQGIPLGIGFEYEWYNRTVALEPGSILAFYTDGLVESDRELDAAESRLLAALGRQARGTQRRSALSLVASTIVGRQRDDIAVLTVATSPTPLREIEVTLPNVAISSRRARLIVERMLRDAQIDEERGFDLEVAVGEAVNNAIEHASKLGSDEFTLRVMRRPAKIVVDVVDRGRWLPTFEMPPAAAPNAERGRGLMLMYALCDEVRLERTPEGTRVQLALAVPLALSA
ncbi:MAG: SpoIIE family protein phosphatase [Candidatus Eremiobacteraeota bacterium]|nr:SpoIIE family protein phosphatase [Candidatus Eremiobacteraeota bacterium]